MTPCLARLGGAAVAAVSAVLLLLLLLLLLQVLLQVLVLVLRRLVWLLRLRSRVVGCTGLLRLTGCEAWARARAY